MLRTECRRAKSSSICMLKDVSLGTSFLLLDKNRSLETIPPSPVIDLKHSASCFFSFFEREFQKSGTVISNKVLTTCEAFGVGVRMSYEE